MLRTQGTYAKCLLMPKNDQVRKAKIVIKHYSTITLKPHAHLLTMKRKNQPAKLQTDPCKIVGGVGHLWPGGGGGAGRNYGNPKIVSFRFPRKVGVQ